MEEEVKASEASERNSEQSRIQPFPSQTQDGGLGANRAGRGYGGQFIHPKIFIKSLLPEMCQALFLSLECDYSHIYFHNYLLTNRITAAAAYGS